MNQSDFQLIDFTSKVARETDLCYYAMSAEPKEVSKQN